jgi:peptidyl-prolyl cis-trans isomerase SurA
MRKTSDTRPPRTRTSILLLAALVVLLAAPRGRADDLNRIVLRVNDEILTLHDYQKQKSMMVTQILASQLPPAEQQERIAQVGKQITQELFRELLLESRAKQLRITVTDEQVEEAVQELLKRQGIEDEATLRQALASAGMTLDQLRDNMRREITFSQVVGREVTSKIDVAEEELRAYYRSNTEQFVVPEERWLKEVIVLEASGASEEELAETAQEIREKLLQGGEFEEVIEPYRSAELATGVIDLDWLEENELDPDLAEVAWQLTPGAYSEPVLSRGGLHILHLAGLREEEQKPFKDVQDQILAIERSRRFNKEMQTFMADLERNAYVKEDLPPEAVGYRTLAEADFGEEESPLDLFRAPTLPSPEEKTEGSGEDKTGGEGER